MHQIRVSRTLLQRLDEHGLTPAMILRQAGLPATFFDGDRIIATAGQWFAIWNAIARSSHDPAIGLKIGSQPGRAASDPITIAALASRTYRDAILRIARYKRLFCSEEVRLLERDGAWAVEVLWTTAREPAPDVLTDAIFASFLEYGRRGTGAPVVPVHVEFRRPARHAALFEDHFQAPVLFAAAEDRLILDRDAIMRPFLTYSPDMLEFLEPQLEASLRLACGETPLSGRVTELLRGMIPGGVPAMRDVARECNMSQRTLQRRLRAEGSGYHQILDAVRHDLARRYLDASGFELGEIAYLLGYEEASSFHRSFARKEGVSPGKWRTLPRCDRQPKPLPAPTGTTAAPARGDPESP